MDSESIAETWHCDFETFSTLDIKTVGATRYGEHCEILMAAIKKGSEEPALWVNPKHRHVLANIGPADELLAEMLGSDAPIFAHNAAFEAAVAAHSLDFPIEITRWRCTARMASFAGVQSSLKMAGYDLELGGVLQKDAAGSGLIMRFSVPQKDGSRVYPSQDALGFANFGLYCLQDVVAEAEVHRVLRSYDLANWPLVLDAYHNTLKMNARGYPVDRQMSENGVAQLEARYEEVREAFDIATRVPETTIQRRLVGALDPKEAISYMKSVTSVSTNKAIYEMHGLTKRDFGDLATDDPEIVRILHLNSGLSPSQRDRVQRWANEKGYSGPDMKGDTLDTLGPLAPEEIRETLAQYRTLSYAAPKKYQAILNSVSPDGNVRGHFMPGGASRTWRWSGTNTQPQNFVNVRDSELKLKVKRQLEAGDRMSVHELADGVRSVIRQDSGFLRGDYSQIEARIINWLAGQDDIVERFAKGEDLYKVMAGLIFGKAAGDIDKKERTLGKIAELGAGYGIWSGGFLASCESYGVAGITEELAEQAVKAYRESHPEVVKFWHECEGAFRKAMRKPGKSFFVGPQRVKFFCHGLTLSDHSQVRMVKITLPSGRPMTYFRAGLGKEINKRGLRPIVYWGKPKVGGWSLISTYGAKLAENISQAVAADIMMEGFNRTEEAGFSARMLVHDEILSDPKPTPSKGVAEFEELLNLSPDWAPGLPINLEAEWVPSYSGV